MNGNWNIDVNWDIILPILVIQFILTIIALFSLWKAEGTRGPKWMWIPIILLGSIIGIVVFFAVGRKETL